MKKRIDPKLPIPDPATASPIEKALFAPDAAGDRIIRRLNELFRESDDGTLAVYDESTYLGQADGLNFVGADVTASASTSLPTGIFDVTVTGGSSGISGITVEDEGVVQGVSGAVDTLNFVGAPVTATVSSNVATITVTAGAQQPIYVYFA